MDSLLVVGSDEKLNQLLSKIGYEVTTTGAERPLVSLLEEKLFDLVVVDARLEPDALSMCEFLRQQESCRKLPIVYLAASSTDYLEAKQRCAETIDPLQPPISLGTVASRIATQLRLRKVAGTSATATLAEANAALRDFNARLSKEREEARAIQESLLPENLPQDPSFEIGVLYEPLEGCGGDWYFARREVDGRISAQISDVTGHGLSAAFIGSMTKLALTAANKSLPHELLREMNRLMSPQLPPGRFVTFGALLFDPTNGEAIYSRAGHLPLLHVKRASREIVEVKGEGFAIGFFPDSEYLSETTALGSNDCVVLLTDGISEVQSRHGEHYGTKRLGEVILSAAPELSAQELVKLCLDDVDRFREGRCMKDDRTLVLLKRR